MDVNELLARIAEDEAAALAATPGPWSWEGDYPKGHCPHGTEWSHHGPDLVARSGVVGSASGYDASGFEIQDADADHIARWNPARVLAECAAKRAIIALHTEYRPHECVTACTTICDTLRALMSVYEAHAVTCSPGSVPSSG